MSQVTHRSQTVINRLAITSVLVILFIALIPLFWIASTAVKPRALTTSIPPTVVFTPELSPFVKLFSSRVQSREEILQEEIDRAPSWEKSVLKGGERVIRNPDGSVQNSGFASRFINSLIISIVSTILAVGMGTLTAYGFSRFRVAGEKDWLFFILSTRMLPPVVVAIPMFLMYRVVGLIDTHLGLIILYTAFNLSFSVWLMKGFMDEIPKEYEEAALVDGYSRLHAFVKIVLPQSVTGIAATSVFCFITAWNEYAFALMMTNKNAQTAPPYIPSQLGAGMTDWTVIAAGALLFLIPVSIFTFLLRDHLLRGVTFGAIRK